MVGPLGTLIEIWIRKAIPTKAEETKELGVAVGQIAEGTLAGAARFPGGCRGLSPRTREAGCLHLAVCAEPGGRKPPRGGAAAGFPSTGADAGGYQRRECGAR